MNPVLHLMHDIAVIQDILTREALESWGQHLGASLFRAPENNIVVKPLNPRRERIQLRCQTIYTNQTLLSLLDTNCCESTPSVELLMHLPTTDCAHSTFLHHNL